MKLKNLIYVPLALYLGCDMRGYPQGIENELEVPKAGFVKTCKESKLRGTSEVLTESVLHEYRQERDNILISNGCELGCEEWYCLDGKTTSQKKIGCLCYEGKKAGLQ